MFVQQGQDGLGVRGAPVEEQGQDVLVLDQRAGVFRSQLGVELVVQGDQLDFLTVDTAFGVDGIDVQQCAVGGLLHPGGDLAAKTCRLADQDLGMAGCTGRQREDQARRPQLPLFCHGGLLLFCVEAAV